MTTQTGSRTRPATARTRAVAFLIDWPHAHTNRCWWNLHEARWECPDPNGARRDRD